MGAYNTFAKIGMDQVIEWKDNKKTQAPSGTEGCSLKSSAMVCHSVSAEKFFF